MNMILLPAARINSVHSSNLLRASIRVNSGKIEFILDTGADINVIDESAQKAIGSQPLKKCSEEAVLFDGRRANSWGKALPISNQKSPIRTAILRCKIWSIEPPRSSNNGRFWSPPGNEKFAARKFHSPISTNAAEKVREIVEKLPQKYAQIFEEGLGLCTKIKAHLTLNPTATPVFRRARPVPYSALPVVNGELERLEKIIGKICPVSSAER
uniref:Peptidase A2 domain-containing protein n=1 Tax=Globodera rostochiensis TaxID=31243 RepID=A0A914HXA5_GLORO